MTTDIVVFTCDQKGFNRIGLLKRTVAHIVRRTRSPFRLYVIDDVSGGKTVAWLGKQHRKGIITGVLRHKKRAGISAGLRDVLSITQSDPVIITDDDVLCPNLVPDWLERGLIEMAARPRLGMLALNNPQCNVGDKRHNKRPDNAITFCSCVGMTFLFVRRALLSGRRIEGKARSPIRKMSQVVAKGGYKVGYLTHVYCQHIGIMSIRSGRDYSRELRKVRPVNDETLEPPDAYKG